MARPVSAADVAEQPCLLVLKAHAAPLDHHATNVLGRSSDQPRFGTRSRRLHFPPQPFHSSTHPLALRPPTARGTAFLASPDTSFPPLHRATCTAHFPHPLRSDARQERVSTLWQMHSRPRAVQPACLDRRAGALCRLASTTTAQAVPPPLRRRVGPAIGASAAPSVPPRLIRQRKPPPPSSLRSARCERGLIRCGRSALIFSCRPPPPGSPHTRV